jgi:hypothetical protein
MTAERRCAAARDRTHDFELVQADVPHCPAVVCLQPMRGGVCRTPGSTVMLKARSTVVLKARSIMVTEDICDLQ